MRVISLDADAADRVEGDARDLAVWLLLRGRRQRCRVTRARRALQVARRPHVLVAERLRRSERVPLPPAHDLKPTKRAEARLLVDESEVAPVADLPIGASRALCALGGGGSGGSPARLFSRRALLLLPLLLLATEPLQPLLMEPLLLLLATEPLQSLPL